MSITYATAASKCYLSTNLARAALDWKVHSVWTECACTLGAGSPSIELFLTERVSLFGCSYP